MMTEIAYAYKADNFKNSVRDDNLHRAYNGVWGVMSSQVPSQLVLPFPRLKSAASIPLFSWLYTLAGGGGYHCCFAGETARQAAQRIPRCAGKRSHRPSSSKLFQFFCLIASLTGSLLQELIVEAAHRWKNEEGDYRDDITAIVIALPLFGSSSSVASPR